MRMQPVLENADVVRIMAAAKACAAQNGWGVSIVILDGSGVPLALERLDGAAPVSVENAAQKAKTAALFGRPSGLFEGMAKDWPALLSLNLQIISGGYPILADGVCVGAIGVSGVTPEQDEQVAMAGLAAL
jgi:uncharacterized protein GlcG (DUF336 family)